MEGWRDGGMEGRTEGGREGWIDGMGIHKHIFSNLDGLEQCTRELLLGLERHELRDAKAGADGGLAEEAGGAKEGHNVHRRTHSCA